MNPVYGNALLLICVIAEIMIIKFFSKEIIPWKEIVVNLQSGHILLWIFRGLSVLAYGFVLQYFSLGIVDQWPVVWQWIFTIVAWDFCFYWSHRFHHAFKILWAVHGVHHEGEHFNLTLGIRNSWYSSLTSYPFFAVLAFIAVPAEIFVTVSGIHFFIQFYNHNHLVKKSGWLEYILITPSHHRVHHGKNDVYVDRNFGGTFVVWDKLFGTFQVEKSDVPVMYGVNDAVATVNPFVINNHRFIKKTHGGKEKTRDNSSSIFYPVFLLASGAFLLFAFLVYFIYVETVIAGAEKFLLFSMLFSGTIANSVLTEGKKWGLFLWCFSGIILNLACLIYIDRGMWVYFLLSIVLLLHAVVSLYYFIKRTSKTMPESSFKTE